jgi:hypothetical protein
VPGSEFISEQENRAKNPMKFHGFVVALLCKLYHTRDGSFEGAPTISGQPKIVPKSWAVVAKIFMRLVDGRHVRVE